MEHRNVFYVVSALRPDSSALGHLRKCDTEKEAVKHAESIMNDRMQKGQPTIGFYILKVEAYVGPVSPLIKTVKLKARRKR